MRLRLCFSRSCRPSHKTTICALCGCLFRLCMIGETSCASRLGALVPEALCPERTDQALRDGRARSRLASWIIRLVMQSANGSICFCFLDDRSKVGFTYTILTCPGAEPQSHRLQDLQTRSFSPTGLPTDQHAFSSHTTHAASLFRCLYSALK